MNKVILLGNLGQDAELKVLGNGQSVLNFSVATTEKWTKDGEKKEKTTWHRCSMWGERATKLAQYLTKGSKVLVDGSIETREYEKDGEKRYATNIKVNNVEFAGGKKNDAPAASSAADDDDLPPVGDDGEIPF